MKKILFLFVFVLILILPISVSARETNLITDWYIKDFSSEIIVNNDSSLNITEKIMADCGNLPNKHGIFRIVPTVYKTETKTVDMPVKLISITDFKGKPWAYEETKDRTNHTLTWKIGDANKTVSGVNEFLIKYKVQNTIRFDNAKFDEFYWNLNGNFWEIETDHFNATIVFPSSINQDNSQGWLYGQNNEKLIFTRERNKILVSYDQAILPQKGLTLSLTFPKELINPYKPTFWDIYGPYLWLIFPLIIFIICFLIWLKYGRDPNLHKTIVPQFEIPDKLSPLIMGAFISQGNMETKYISASITHLAVKKELKIEEIPAKGLFGKKDYRLVLDQGKLASNDPAENALFDALFEGKTTVLISSLKDKFSNKVTEIQTIAKEELIKNDLFFKDGFRWKTAFMTIGIILLSLSFSLWFVITILANLFAMGISGLIIFFFSLLMPKMTAKGADLRWKIEGFKLYMKTAEKYRQKFNDQEGIFERFLPYAMLFGLTDIWIKKIKEIYGEKYYQNYHPSWYVGVAAATFDLNSFNSSMTSLSESISSNMSSSSSGSDGGGFSGGGGGGGGGGW